MGSYLPLNNMSSALYFSAVSNVTAVINKGSFGDHQIAILTLSTLQSILGQQERGFISVSDSTKVKVILECGAKFMNVQLIFNETVTPKFEDYIIVGTTKSSECELRGTGQTKYIIEIPIINDPCGTQMIDKGAFENRIRIAQNKQIVLGGDELVTVRCLYGPPKIAGYEIPNIPQTDQSLSSGRGGGISNGGQTGGERVRTVSGGAFGGGGRLPVGYVYLIVFLVLFLALLFLLCGCLYFFFKRRKLRLEKRKNLVIAVPPGAELGKMGGLGHLWWSGKNTISNDALLSHDYMLSSNSNREGGLSVSTEYAGETPSTSSSGGSPGHPHPHQHQQRHHPNGGRGGGGNEHQLYIQDPRGLLHRGGHYPQQHYGDRQLDETMRSQSITTVQNKSYSSTEWKTTNGHGHHVAIGPNHAAHAAGGVGVVYAHVDMNAKKGNKKYGQHYTTTAHHTIGQHQMPPHQIPPSSSSVQPEIYIHPRDDGGSVSTLEGGTMETEDTLNRRGVVVHSGYQNNEGGMLSSTVTADVHAAGVLRQAAGNNNSNNNKKTGQLFGGGHPEADREWTEEYVKIMEEHRGIGPRKMNEQEIARWRHLVENDSNIQELIRRARTAEEFETLPSHPQYAKLFPAEKWNLIVHSLAQITFMRKLNSIIDNNNGSHSLSPPAANNPLDDTMDEGDHQHESSTTIIKGVHNSDENHQLGGSKRRYIKKSEGNTSGGVLKQVSTAAVGDQQQSSSDPMQHVIHQPAAAGRHEHTVQQEERIFTRDSYYRVKHEMGTTDDDEEVDETTTGAAYHAVEFTRERATTETVERVPQVMMTGSEDTPPPPPPPSSIAVQRRTHSESSEPPPPLSVYVGNQAERVLPHGKTRQGITYGHGSSTYDNWQDSPDEL